MKHSSMLAATVLLGLAACESRDAADSDAGSGTVAAPPTSAAGPVLEAPMPFDRTLATSVARALLRRPESDITPGPNLRIIRRGREDRPVTMDFRPGRMSVELDDDGTGRYVVTRVSVEVPEGDKLVVE